MRVRVLGMVLAVAIVGAMTALAPMSAAAAAPVCQTDTSAVPGDVDGDGTADLVVGIPNRLGGRGGVDLRLSSAASQVVTRSGIGGAASKPGDDFGASVALIQANDDTCSDLLIGAPGIGGGHVYLVFGSPTGFQPTGVININPASVEAGDRFGAAIASELRFNKPGYDVWISAPTDDVKGVKDAGSIRRYYVVASGSTATVSFAQAVREDSDHVRGVLEAGDRFGTVLSAAPLGLLVGSPDENSGKVVNAGSATLIRVGWGGSSAGDVVASQTLAQTGDTPGAPERGDHFGAAVSWYDHYALVGVPGEDVGTLTDAGAAQSYVWDPGTDRLEPQRFLTQDAEGIPGVAERGDAFGSAVQVGFGLLCQEGIAGAIGTPYEDVGATKNAGTVTMLPLDDSCTPPVSLRQGDGLPGSTEPGDHVGQTLAIKPHDADEDTPSSLRYEQVFVSAPGENLGGTIDAGLVQVTPPATSMDTNGVIRVHGQSYPSAAYSGGAKRNQEYGGVLWQLGGSAIG